MRKTLAMSAAQATALAVTVAATALATATASATPPPAPGSGLLLTAAERSVTLVCEPAPHGSHPLAQPACTALAAAGGDFDALPGQPTVCQGPYEPIVVTARGEFRGQPVDWRKKFANPCILRAATGPVFAFTDLG